MERRGLYVAFAPFHRKQGPVQGRSQGGRGGPPPPESGGSQKYIRGDPCDLGSEAKNRGSPPPEMGGAPPKLNPGYALGPVLSCAPKGECRKAVWMCLRQGRSQDLVSGGGTHFGGPDPLFFVSDPKSQGSPLMYFWLPPDFGGGAGPPPPPPGYALGLRRKKAASGLHKTAAAASTPSVSPLTSRPVRFTALPESFHQMLGRNSTFIIAQI